MARIQQEKTTGWEKEAAINQKNMTSSEGSYEVELIDLDKEDGL